MSTADAVSHFGSIKVLAAAIGIWPHNIYRWGERPPMLRQYQIERLTAGELKADE